MGGDKFEGKISADPLTNDGLHLRIPVIKNWLNIFVMDWVTIWISLKIQMLIPKT